MRQYVLLRLSSHLHTLCLVKVKCHCWWSFLSVVLFCPIPTIPRNKRESVFMRLIYIQLFVCTYLLIGGGGRERTTNLTNIHITEKSQVDPAMQVDLLGQNGVRGVLAASPVEREASRPGRGIVLWGFYPPCWPSRMSSTRELLEWWGSCLKECPR